MFTHRLYYALKPYIPWSIRIVLRRVAARRKRETCRTVWPINEAAGRTPANWPGWPDGKRFSVVLTHDVEGPAGLAKCRQLAELEMKLGFRSSFNFIPEGSYAVPADLRGWLTDHGFEVGVHDLEHDGRLFRSRDSFKRKVKRINHHIRAWGASGFRAGFMLRNLDWVHDLDIAYDASTFDTDPFELQSDGSGTIFPFWIPTPPASSRSQAPFHEAVPANSSNASSRGGYVELPYTLPQDSTLYLVLRETSSNIWLRKTEWIAKNGGMALVNVHPDYVQFDGEKPSPRTFSVRFYADLLNHIRTQHADAYWQAIPKKVAQFLRQSPLCPAPPEQYESKSP